MLILPPCVMHTYYKTKHLQTLVLSALMMLAFFLGKKKKKERSYFKGYHQQIICATEEQWFDSPDVLILGVLIGEARAERLAHVKIQKDRFIKMWEWRTFLVAKILSSQCSGSRFEPWSGNKIPHATIKDPACCKEDQKSLMPQLWLSTAK